MNKSTEVFKKFGKTIPKDCYVVIIKDIKGGSTDFMCYGIEQDYLFHLLF